MYTLPGFHLIPCPGEASHGLLRLVGNPYGCKITTMESSCTFQGVSTVSFYAFSGLFRNQGRSHYFTIVPHSDHLMVDVIITGVSFVTNQKDTATCFSVSFFRSLSTVLGLLALSPRYTGSDRPGFAIAAAMFSLWASNPKYSAR